jgi:hypothetical protein
MIRRIGVRLLELKACGIGRLSQELTYLAEETARLLEYEGTAWKYDRVEPDPGHSQVEMK